MNHLNLSRTKQQIASNIIWAVIGKAVTLLGALATAIIVARYLGPEQYGLLNYIVSFVFLFQVFALFGMDNIEIREEAKEQFPVTTIIGTAFLIKVVLAIITMVICITTAWAMHTDTRTLWMIGIYSFSILATTLFVIRNNFTALVQNEYVVKSEMCRTIICLALKIGLVLIQAHFVWFIVASLLDVVLVALGYVAAYTKHIGNFKLWKFDKQCAIYLLKEAWPLLLTNAAVIIYQRIDQVMIGRLISNESLGFFCTAARFTEVLIYIPTVMAQTITPVLIRLQTTNQQAYSYRAQQFMNVTFWGTLILAALTSLLSGPLVLYTFGNEYLAAVPLLQVLAFKSASVALSSTAGNLLVAEGLQKYAIFRDILGCIVCVTLNYLLLPRYGVAAAAWIAILCNLIAGYIADLIIPPYNHLFTMQTKAILTGWKDIIHIKQLFSQ